MGALSIMTTCPRCGAEFAVTSDSNQSAIAQAVVDKSAFMCDGRWYFLTYYVCPACDSIIFVQADNDETNKILLKSTQIIKGLIQSGKKGNSVVKQRYDEHQQRLGELRGQLQEQLEGKFMYSRKLQKEVEVHFTNVN